MESLLKEDSAIEGKGGGVSYSVRKWAIKQGKTTGLCLQTGTYKSGTSLAKKLKFHAAEALVFNRIRKQLGLHKVPCLNQINFPPFVRSILETIPPEIFLVMGTYFVIPFAICIYLYFCIRRIIHRPVN